jgi:hypothetical protein
MVRITQHELDGRATERANALAVPAAVEPPSRPAAKILDPWTEDEVDSKDADRWPPLIGDARLSFVASSNPDPSAPPTSKVEGRWGWPNPIHR